jgi:hypothetical protein
LPVLTIAMVTPDMALDGAAIVAEVPPRQGGVAPVDAARGQRRGQDAVGPVGFGDDEQAGGFLVEPVDDAGPLIPGFGRQLAAPADEGVDEGSRPVARGRMHDHASGLVNDEHVVVLVDDDQRKRFADDFNTAWCRDDDADLLGNCRAIAGLLELSIDEDVSSRDQRGGGGARQIGGRGHDQVKALPVADGNQRQRAGDFSRGHGVALSAPRIVRSWRRQHDLRARAPRPAGGRHS